jgi:cyclohexadienyl dehydratase
MAWLLPRGDTSIKGWMDTWFHLAKASGDYDRIAGRWLR